MNEEQKQAINELAELLHKNNLSEIEYEGVYSGFCRGSCGEILPVGKSGR